jgi:hypothetical protein
VNESFGRHLLQLSPEAGLAAERESGACATFAQIDALTDQIVRGSITGEQVATVVRGEPVDELHLAITNRDRDVLEGAFRLGSQQARGAWFLPEQATLHVGNANLPYHCRRHARFASEMARGETIRVDFRESSEALYYWSVLEPLIDLIYRPFIIRSDCAGLSREEQLELWSKVEANYGLLGVNVRAALAVFKFGGGWSKLRAPEQISARERLLEALAASLGEGTPSLHRIARIQGLLHRYYQRAKRGATAPKMRQVLSKDFQKVVSGFFGGDWLSFLRYIGETAHPDERIAKALPEPKLYVLAKERVPTVAAAHSISPIEIERILRAFWGGEHSESPVQRRVAALEHYWLSFDQIHSRQAPGDKPLWGFVPESRALALHGAGKGSYGPSWYAPGSYESLLPTDLLEEIEQLWSGFFLSTRPTAIVSTVSPQGLMAETFGPALRFWHGAGLTAWFVSEGPYSRTNMAGLANYHRRDLSQLEALSCPIDRSLFDELMAAEKKLGKPMPINDPHSEHRTDLGTLTLTMSVQIGSRRDGFLSLRNILRAYRRDWTKRYLDKYFRALWEAEIRTAAREYNRLLEKKGKAPSIKQFARFADDATNHWFGGDVSALFAAFGEKSPVAPDRVRFLPRDVQKFMWRVFVALGGKATSFDDLEDLEQPARSIEWGNHLDRKRLAEYSPRYVQLCEGSGQTPSLKEFGRTMFQQGARILAEDIEEAWSKYGEIVERTLQEFG